MHHHFFPGRVLPDQFFGFFFENFSGFHTAHLGMLIGEETPNGFEISHEFTARFGSTFTNGLCLIPDGEVDRWCSGEDIRDYTPTGPTASQVVVVTDNLGRNLGRGKLQKNLLKNLLPKRMM